MKRVQSASRAGRRSGFTGPLPVVRDVIRRLDPELKRKLRRYGRHTRRSILSRSIYRIDDAVIEIVAVGPPDSISFTPPI